MATRGLQRRNQGLSAGTVIEVDIPWIPPALNVTLRMHWSKRSKLTETAGLYLMAAGLVRRQPEASTRVRVTIQMHRKNPTDRDGAQGACKPIFDAIRRLGWAVDDSERWMEQIVQPVIIDRKRPRTRIKIEEIA